MENFVKIGRICELLSVTRPTIYKWIRENGLPVIKIKPLGSDISASRFKVSEVTKWFEEFQQ